MEFLDFLQYGAIGISLALAILSFRLLYKEQDKKEVRGPILNTIKLYLLFSIVITLIFASVELVPKFLNYKQPQTNMELQEIWKAHFSEFPDTTLSQKADRISQHILSNKSDSSMLCENIAKELAKCTEELKKFDSGFYQNVVKLQNAIKKDSDNWINLSFQVETKQEAIISLKGIFRSLGQNYDGLTDQEVVQKWITFKSKWTSEQSEYIFQSDISQIVREYLIAFYSAN